MTISVCLADDNLLVREGVRALMELEDDIEVVGVAAISTAWSTEPRNRSRRWSSSTWAAAFKMAAGALKDRRQTGQLPLTGARGPTVPLRIAVARNGSGWFMGDAAIARLVL